MDRLLSGVPESGTLSVVKLAVSLSYKVRRVVLLAFRNPRLLGKKLLLRLRRFKRMPVQPFERDLGGVLFTIDPALREVARDIYLGTYELDVVEAIRRLLPEGGTFIDIGAHIGYLSAVAASCVGMSGQVHAFEPVPQLFERLEQLARANPAHQIVLNRCALGSEPGKASIDVAGHAKQTFSSLVPGYTPEHLVESRLEVQVIRLDHYVETRKLERLDLVKIDTEGFELEILEGGSRILSDGWRPPIICEIHPDAFAFLGKSLRDLSQFLRRHRYRVVSLVNPELPVQLEDFERDADNKVGDRAFSSGVLFLPD